MKATKLNSKKQENLVTLSNDELKNVYGGGSVYFVQKLTSDNKIIWQIVIR